MLVHYLYVSKKSRTHHHTPPIVHQVKTEPIEIATTNELGEFQFDFDPRPDLRLEIGVRENHWLSLELPDPKGAVHKMKDGLPAREAAGDIEILKGPFSKKRW